MIERKFVEEKLNNFQIQEYIEENLQGVGHSHTTLQRTPLGEKIIIFASRPGLIVGRKGQNIKKLTVTLKKKFNLENPQIEISEVEKIDLDPAIVAERIANSLERFGSGNFKGAGHKALEQVMNSGALGVEIIISGKIPSSRAKTWRFYSGYLKKCGDIAIMNVKKAITAAQLKTGTVGIRVKIMPPDTKLPDDIKFVEVKPSVEEISSEETDKGNESDEKEEKAEKSTKKKETTERKKPTTKKKLARKSVEAKKGGVKDES